MPRGAGTEWSWIRVNPSLALRVNPSSGYRVNPWGWHRVELSPRADCRLEWRVADERRLRLTLQGNPELDPVVGCRLEWRVTDELTRESGLGLPTTLVRAQG